MFRFIVLFMIAQLLLVNTANTAINQPIPNQEISAQAESKETTEKSLSHTPAIYQPGINEPVRSSQEELKNRVPEKSYSSPQKPLSKKQLYAIAANRNHSIEQGKFIRFDPEGKPLPMPKGQSDDWKILMTMSRRGYMFDGSHNAWIIPVKSDAGFKYIGGISASDLREKSDLEWAAATIWVWKPAERLIGAEYNYLSRDDDMIKRGWKYNEKIGGWSWISLSLPKSSDDWTRIDEMAGNGYEFDHNANCWLPQKLGYEYDKDTHLWIQTKKAKQNAQKRIDAMAVIERMYDEKTRSFVIAPLGYEYNKKTYTWIRVDNEARDIERVHKWAQAGGEETESDGSHYVRWGYQYDISSNAWIRIEDEGYRYYMASRTWRWFPMYTEIYGEGDPRSRCAEMEKRGYKFDEETSRWHWPTADEQAESSSNFILPLHFSQNIKNSTVSMQDASGTIQVSDGGILTNFGISLGSAPSLNLYLSGDATVLQNDNQLELDIIRPNDTIFITGKNNKLLLKKSITIQGALRFNNNSELLIEFDSAAVKPEIVLDPSYAELADNVRLKFNGKVSVRFKKTEIQHKKVHVTK